MIGASYFFYAWWDLRFILLLAGVLGDRAAGRDAVARQPDERRKRIAMVAGVALDAAAAAVLQVLLCFVAEPHERVELARAERRAPARAAVLPVGISFFTFMAISYIVDVYRGARDASRAGSTSFLYLSFFPHLVAGPIVRPDELIPQLDERRDPRHIDVAGASWLIIGGLFKKVVVSSFLATTIVDPVFGDPASHSAIDALFGILAYAIVIYADFSGYTDIAIGVAKLLGFQFPQNFDRPYSARSLQDFWRRWHMTLSRWLRDYLYIPLGGSKRARSAPT